MKLDNISDIVTNSSIFCTGCSACVYTCPVSAIHMSENEEGFLYPEVDENICTHCGLCRRVCPVYSPEYSNKKNPDCFVAMANDELREGKSTSGAVFPILAQEVLRCGGAVCGAAFRPDWTVAHIIIEDKEGLERLKNSKYVQSDMSDCFPKIKNLLEAGRLVLFSGTGCQVAGLKGFLRKEYQNLWCIEVICHGVPSPGVWKKYLNEKFDVSHIKSIEFRSKKYAWGEPIARVVCYNNIIYEESYTKGIYYSNFGNNIILRNSCGHCQFNRLPRQADITIGDFWGIDKKYPQFNDGKGTSVILVNNIKGYELLNKVKYNFKVFNKVLLNDAIPGNPNIISSSKENSYRDIFFKIFKKRSVQEALSFTAKDLSDCKIINFWFTKNYGAALTCYALQEALFNIGYTAKVINYMPSHWRKMYSNTFSESFAKKYLYLTKPLKNYADLIDLNHVTTNFLVGSDQVFRYDFYKGDGDHAYQLGFVQPNKRKIACSASFGTLDYIAPPEEIERFFSNLNQFDAVSVRETPGVSICKKRGISAEQIIEPVFYLSQDEWNKLADNHNEEHNKGVIYFSLGYKNASKNPKVIDFISKKTGEPINIQTFNYQRSVEDWLDSIRSASFVVTDSFHGMCFAIIFHKPFVVLCSYSEMRSRMDEILSLLGLQNRIIDPEADGNFEELLIDIDWNNVDSVLEKEKNRALSWLKEKLQAPIKKKELLNVRLDYLEEKVKQMTSNNSSNFSSENYQCYEDIALIYNRFRIIRKYYWYKLLSKITSGQRRKHYKTKRYLWHDKIRRLRELKKRFHKIIR